MTPASCPFPTSRWRCCHKDETAKEDSLDYSQFRRLLTPAHDSSGSIYPLIPDSRFFQKQARLKSRGGASEDALGGRKGCNRTRSAHSATPRGNSRRKRKSIREWSRPDFARVRLHLTLNKDDGMTGQRRHARARGDPTGEVEGVGRRQDLRLVVGQLGGGSEYGNDFGQRILLAGHAGHEAAASNFAARLQAAIAPYQLLPGRGGGLVGQQVAKHDAVAPEQQPAPALDPLLGCDCGRQGRAQQRPAAGRVRG